MHQEPELPIHQLSLIQRLRLVLLLQRLRQGLLLQERLVLQPELMLQVLPELLVQALRALLVLLQNHMQLQQSQSGLSLIHI